jgi:NRPS condensation-like uncharacterized protein
MQKPLPSGVIAISPWVDLTNSGQSVEENKDTDPTLTKERLDFFAKCYADGKQEHPLVSPLLGSLDNMPASLIFVGEKELLADDGRRLHNALLQAGNQSRLVVAPEMWHGYLLYDLEERQADFDCIEKFISETLQDTRKLRWMRLDNAAKIYPAARRRNWNNRFRLSVTLTSPVEPEILQSAVDVTLRRFPSIGARIRRGVFWYYIEELKTAPRVSGENSYPFPPISFYDLRKCALRVVYYGNRFGVEFSHTLTDGTGGMIFLKTLLAEYLTQLYHIQIPSQKGVLDRLTAPTAMELEDSFLKYAGPKAADRKEETAYHLKGTPEKDGFLHVTTGMIPAQDLLKKAHEYEVSLTAFLTAVLIRSLLTLQDSHVKKHKQKPVKVLVPVNLRNLFESTSLRNFALYTTPGVDPKLGDYTLEEIVKAVHHHMGLDVTPKRMAAKIATNVNSEKSLLIKMIPLFVKNGVMKMVFNMVGECKSCLSLSNLGNVDLPEEMKPYVKRFDFVLGVQATAPYNCGVVSYNGKVYINIIRNTKEPFLERQFFTDLLKLGLSVEVESNGR